MQNYCKDQVVRKTGRLSLRDANLEVSADRWPSVSQGRGVVYAWCYRFSLSTPEEALNSAMP